MTTLGYALTDSVTMLRRNLRRQLRYPVLTLLVIGIPVILLLLFVYVFGAALGAGLVPGLDLGAGRSAYLGYVVPGIVLLAVASSAQGTSISVATDMAEGIIARFRTMAIARVSVLTGHVVGSTIQTMVGIAVVFGVAYLVGFRATAGPLEWLAVTGLLTMVTLAITWFAVALGLSATNVEAASNLPMPLILLPFLGSGFVPPESMPPALGWFAEHQPFTPIIETLRGLLFGDPIGSSASIAVAWCVAITLASYLWSKSLYNRDPSP
jgi:ABC-2 type transport system permease protein